VTAADWVLALRRRWYVLAVILLCTLAGIFAVRHRPITYEACEGLYLSGPPQFSNVYLNQNPSLAMMTGAVTTTMTSPAMEQKLQSSGLMADYTVVQTNTGEIRQPSWNLPTLQICVTSRSSQATLGGLPKVTSQFRTVLHDMQAAQHAKPGSLIVAATVSPPVVTAIVGKPSQAYIGVLLIGLIGGVSVTLWTDLLLKRRDGYPLTGWGQRLRRLDPRRTAGSPAA
jgi:hypothetical protein